MFSLTVIYQHFVSLWKCDFETNPRISLCMAKTCALKRMGNWQGLACNFTTCVRAKYIIKALPLCFSSYFIAFYCSRCLQLCVKEGLEVHCASSSTGKQTVTSWYDSASVWRCKEQGEVCKGERLLSPNVDFFPCVKIWLKLKKKKKNKGKIIILNLEVLYVACGWTLLNTRAAVRLNTSPWWPWRSCNSLNLTRIVSSEGSHCNMHFPPVIHSCLQVHSGFAGIAISASSLWIQINAKAKILWWSGDIAPPNIYSCQMDWQIFHMVLF